MPTTKKTAPVKKAAPVKTTAPAKTTAFTSVEDFTQVHETVMDLPQERIAPVIPLHPDGMVVVPLVAGPRAAEPPHNDDPKIATARLLRLRQQER